MATKTEAIRSFLLTTGNYHLTKLYNSEMEVQVNVAQDDGERVKGQYRGKTWTGWKKGDEQWKSFRIPWSADSQPSFTDSQMTYSLAKHTLGIGMTGWNWVKKQSCWAGFDFDSIVNHKAGLTNDQLEEIKQKLMEVNYTTIVKSTSGNGLHVYVFLKEVFGINTHTEHAAVCRSVLSQLSGEIGYNLSASVDCVGSILWCYHRKQEGTDGLSLIKKGEELEKLPSNWRDHIEVTSRRKKRIKSRSRDEAFKELAASVPHFKLDEEHKLLLTFLKDKAERDWWWDSDHNMLVAHTFDLKKAHSALEMRGRFETISSGSSTQNCFAFPSAGGAWTVRRHGFSVNEAPTWQLDPSGWTKCMLNELSDFETACKSNHGIENAQGEYVFEEAKHACSALNDMLVRINLPDPHASRPAYLKLKGDSKILFSIDANERHNKPDGFIVSKNGKRYERIINCIRLKKPVNSPDYLIRHVISEGIDAGWCININGEWIIEPRQNVITTLITEQETANRTDVEKMMGKAIKAPWKLVNIPFEEEYPGNRLWNRNAAAFSCKPQEGSHPTWDAVLGHIGESLDTSVATDEWCQRNAIMTGAEFLTCWIAAMFQKPFEPLPYLFLYGPQNTGKSTLHEALSKLFTHGYTRADHALMNSSGFNGELHNAVLCVVEEADLRRNREAGNRIKDWVTGKTISIRALFKNPYNIVNSTHWIHCANDVNSVPILPGDTRILPIYVDKPKTEIPKLTLFSSLEKEKPYFLNTVLNIDLPAPESRLVVPCIQTFDKVEIESSNRSALDVFIEENVYTCEGQFIWFNDFYIAFYEWLDPADRDEWTKMKTARNYPKDNLRVKGVYGNESKVALGNVTFNKEDKPHGKFRLTSNNRLDWQIQEN